MAARGEVRGKYGDRQALVANGCLTLATNTEDVEVYCMVLMNKQESQ